MSIIAVPFFFTMNLSRAIEIATDAHKGQVDKYGQPYIGHVLRVMQMGRTEEEKIVGVLHDIVEDTDWTFEALEQEGLAPQLLAALYCVTKLDEDEDYEHFVDRTLQNRLACMVKLNDLTDNMDIRRMTDVKEKDIARLNKYLHAYRRIAAAVIQ
ncbi:phosphohydrolase [Chitinophaga arvensicola]|uniref:HD domain-containing protein n=1 Tax=Chitinophaga arvensicola TaxID=29529 RepID=A0A1I0R222_9BACT|nr:phosphohydrolase [Chitinophaga arvensicola]SEW33773.1 HD domain-containing protein [Chitinophaga arvensicola]